MKIGARDIKTINALCYVPCQVLGELFILDQLGHQISARYVFHHKIQVFFVLKFMAMVNTKLQFNLKDE